MFLNHKENKVTLAIEILQESLKLGRLGVIFPLFGGPFPGSHVCLKDKQKRRKKNPVKTAAFLLH